MALTDKSRLCALSSSANDFAANGSYPNVAKEKGHVLKLARVRGTVVASIKARGLAAQKLLLLEAVAASDPLAPSTLGDAASQQMLVAVDLAGAGVGEVVLVVQGSAARVDREGQSVPTDAAVVAIVDSVQVDDRTTFVKS